MGFQKRMHMQQLTVSFALTRGGEIFQSQSSLVLTGCVMCLIGDPFQRPAGEKKSQSQSPSGGSCRNLIAMRWPR